MISQARILVIRGGAIGDFILTLPAIALLRENFPAARIEILGYKHIIALAEGRFYCQATRCIEYGAMAGFFVPGAELDPELVTYFASFQQVVSYLYDPNAYFEANLRKAGVKNFLPAYSPAADSEHAAQQLARPLERLALFLESPAAKVYPSESDRQIAAELGIAPGSIAIHPGSGSVRKNWLLGRWAEVCRVLLERYPEVRLLLVGGEADVAALETLRTALPARVQVLRDLPLPHLAAVLERCQLFLGHDSGISHLAAAVGAPCVLLFGPTDPAVWAPVNDRVQVIEAPGNDFSRLHVEQVIAAAMAMVSSRGA